MKTYALKSNLKQDYNVYTPEDFEVWKILFERQMRILNQLACEEYLEGIKTIVIENRPLLKFLSYKTTFENVI